MRVVADLMSRHVVTLWEDEDLSRPERFLNLRHVRHLPVVRGRRFLGLVTQWHILRACAQEKGHQVLARDVMENQVSTVSPETPLLHAIRAMLGARCGCLPVVDERGALVGILSEADLVRFAADSVFQVSAVGMGE